MRDVTYEPREILELAGVGPQAAKNLMKRDAARAVLQWVAHHMVRLVENCPECGAVPEIGEKHGDRCPIGLEYGEDA